MDSNSDWGRIAEAVALRRREMGYKTQQEAADAAGVGVQTWRQIEGAKQDHYRPGTLAAVAQVLDWPSNMLTRIGQGEEPVSQRIDQEGFLDLRSEIAELRALIEDVRDVVLSLGGRHSADSPPAEAP